MNKRRKRTFYKKIWLLLLEIENELVKKSNWFTIISRNQSLLWETKRRGRKERKKPQISDLKIDEGNSENSQENDNSWFSSWSALSTTFDSPKSKKGEFSNDDEEEDKWWSSFWSKERNESKSESFFSTQPSSSSQSTQEKTYQHKLALIIKKMMTKMIARSSFALYQGNTKNLNSFNCF